MRSPTNGAFVKSMIFSSDYPETVGVFGFEPVTDDDASSARFINVFIGFVGPNGDDAVMGLDISVSEAREFLAMLQHTLKKIVEEDRQPAGSNTINDIVMNNIASLTNANGTTPDDFRRIGISENTIAGIHEYGGFQQ